MFKLLIPITLTNSIPLYMDYQVQEDYVPIIGYHDIEEIFVDDSLTTTIENFRQQVEYLTNTGKCNWITMERLAYYVANEEKLPTNACIMNFDDGGSSQYHNTLCTLNEFKIPATFYIATDNIGTRDYYMKNSEVDNLYNIGHDLGAHSLTHAHLSKLTIEGQENEIFGSKIELENKGYNVSTFAYPYGEFNLDTLDILRDSEEFVLIRDITQRNTWKDPRTPVISYMEDFLLHFFYIKPEKLNDTELYDIVKYTGWWQFEDNYEKISGGEYDIKGLSDPDIIPTDTSYIVLNIPKEGNEISTPFLTKYEGGFTLDIIAYNSTTDIQFKVTIDDIEYEVNAYNYGDEHSVKYGITWYNWYNFYVNIDNLSPGAHKLNIIKTDSNKFYIDKFRLFSNVNQDFTYESYYKECNPEEDKYCFCSSHDDNISSTFNLDKFIKNIKESTILLMYSVIGVSVFICIIYICFSSNKKEKRNNNINIDNIEIVI